MLARPRDPSLRDSGRRLVACVPAAVDPAHRGHGISRALADECARRARRDGAKALALFTSPAMKIAIAMYRRMGFEYVRDIPAVYGMAAELYVLPIRKGT